MKRSRPLVVVAGLAVAGIIMLSWTQTWFTVHLHAGAAVAATVDADGAATVPQYTALAIASLALFLAMTIAGRIVRIVLAVVEILLGLGVVVSGISALHDPIAAARGAVGEVAGVSDLSAVRRVVSTVDVSIWPAVGIVGGVLAVLLGVVVLVVQRSWPGPSRKYAASTAGAVGTAGARGTSGTVGDGVTKARAAAVPARAAAPVPRDAIVDWDDLSAGVDPTSDDGGDGPVAGATTDDTVGSDRHRSNDGVEAERGAP